MAAREQRVPGDHAGGDFAHAECPPRLHSNRPSSPGRAWRPGHPARTRFGAARSSSARCAIRGNIELSLELPRACRDLLCRDGFAEGPQVAHFEQLEVVAEAGRLLRQVAIDVQHAAVVMPQHAHAVVPHPGRDLGGVDPVANLVPGLRIVK